MKKMTKYLLILIVTGSALFLMIVAFYLRRVIVLRRIKIETEYIPSGIFTMGSPTDAVDRYTDEIEHDVTLSAFLISTYEITNGQYARFLNAKSIGSDGQYTTEEYSTQVLIYASDGDTDWGLHFTGSQWIPVAGYENHPVIGVTWFGAKEFATYLGGSLPTEAQWEYACRARTETPFNTGECLTDEQANYIWAQPLSTCTNTNTISPGKTQPVGSYAPNAFGLFDMHGNVYEWCNDWYGRYSTEAQTDPTGPESGELRVFRGGGWYLGARDARSAWRNKAEPTNSYSFGFRIVFHRRYWFFFKRYFK